MVNVSGRHMDTVRAHTVRGGIHGARWLLDLLQPSGSQVAENRHGTSYGHPVRADRPPPSTATRVLHGVRAARGVQHIPAHLEKACDVGPVPGDTLRSIVGCAEADLVPFPRILHGHVCISGDAVTLLPDGFDRVATGGRGSSSGANVCREFHCLGGDLLVSRVVVLCPREKL